MKGKKPKPKPTVAHKRCSTCDGYDYRFCKNCGQDVDQYNRCGECNRFVKTEPCPECYGEGFEAEYVVGEKVQLYVSDYSNKEIRDHVGFKGFKYKTYSAKIVDIVADDEVTIRVKGKEITISTEEIF